MSQQQNPHKMLALVSSIADGELKSKLLHLLDATRAATNLLTQPRSTDAPQHAVANHEAQHLAPARQPVPHQQYQQQPRQAQPQHQQQYSLQQPLPQQGHSFIVPQMIPHSFQQPMTRNVAPGQQQDFEDLIDPRLKEMAEDPGLQNYATFHHYQPPAPTHQQPMKPPAPNHHQNNQMAWNWGPAHRDPSNSDHSPYVSEAESWMDESANGPQGFQAAYASQNAASAYQPAPPQLKQHYHQAVVARCVNCGKQYDKTINSSDCRYHTGNSRYYERQWEDHNHAADSVDTDVMRLVQQEIADWDCCQQDANDLHQGCRTGTHTDQGPFTPFAELEMVREVQQKAPHGLPDQDMHQMARY